MLLDAAAALNAAKLAASALTGANGLPKIGLKLI
jgi:hypothetical protein